MTAAPCAGALPMPEAKGSHDSLECDNHLSCSLTLNPKP